MAQRWNGVLFCCSLARRRDQETMTLASTQTLGLKVPDRTDLEMQVGGTPLIRLNSVAQGLPPAVTILGKAEWFNPSGSIKDRPALHIIRTALERRLLGTGKRLLDSTSGNMGIAYATFGAALGIGVTLCVPENASPERLMILRALGAEVVLTPAADGTDGAIHVARQMATEEASRFWYANQYDNPSNWEAHYLSTGPELFGQTSGTMTHFVAGVGTSGTLMGTGRYLKEHLPEVKIVGVQPDVALHGLEGLKHMPTAIRPGIYEEAFVERTVPVATDDAHAMVRKLARDEGLFVGVSSGAAVQAAVKIGSELDRGTIVAMMPDAGFKYLSENGLWETT
jgi:S-sulfo-L-cysteine synthase (O-acetyl-L-serine-dependent)